MPVLALYLSFVAQITITSRITDVRPLYNLMLFWSYQAIAEGRTTLIMEVFWNLVLFVPIGILLMIILTVKRKWLITVVFGLLLSSCIEVVQLIFHRGLFEFDDIFHNTLGTVIGIAIYIIVFKLRSVFGVFKKAKE